MVFVLPAQAQIASRQLGDVGSPDTSLIYSAEEIYGWAEAYGPDGRGAYLRARWTFDLAWPMVYGLFLVTAISWVGQRAYGTGSRAHRLNLVPVAAVFFDLAENTLASIVMLRYPGEATVAATLASPVSVVKWMFVVGSFIVLLVGVLRWLWKTLAMEYSLRSNRR